MDTSSLSDLVRDARVEMGMSQAELAEAVGKSQEWVSKIETGAIHSPHRKTLERLAFVLHRSFTDLIIASGYASNRAEAKRVEVGLTGGEQTVGDRVDSNWEHFSDGERASIQAMLRTERNYLTQQRTQAALAKTRLILPALPY